MSAAPSAFSVVLSHAELVYLLTLFDSAPVLGIDRDPFEGYGAEAMMVAHVTARDALRARDLLHLDAEARPLVNDDLLCVLESYARPQQIVTAYRYAVGEELPLVWFGYRSADATVIHTRPDDLLHAFALAPDVSFLAKALVDFCTGGAASARSGSSLSLPGGVMAAARASADAGQADQVVRVLRTAGLDEDVSAALAADLNNPAAVTAITFAATDEDAQVRRRDAIYWQSTTPTARLIVYTEGGAVQVSNASDADLRVILNEMM